MKRKITPTALLNSAIAAAASLSRSRRFLQCATCKERTTLNALDAHNGRFQCYRCEPPLKHELGGRRGRQA